MNRCGMIELDRVPHPWGNVYRRLAVQAREGVDPRSAPPDHEAPA